MAAPSHTTATTATTATSAARSRSGSPRDRPINPTTSSAVAPTWGETSASLSVRLFESMGVDNE